MRQFSPPLKEHVGGNVTTICTCWIIRRRDGTVLGFTDHDQTLQVGDVDCHAAAGFSPTQAVHELGLASDSQDIEGALSAASISEDDLSAGLYDGAKVEVWLVNWASIDQQHHMRTNLLGEVSREDGIFKAELRGLTSVLDQTQARSFSRSCDAQLGDSRCKVDLSTTAFTTTGSVTRTIDRRRFECIGLESHSAGWFARGQLTWTSGANAGQSIEVAGSKLQRVDMLELWASMPLGIAIGDEFFVSAGCDKSFSVCKSKFSNAINFQGCPHMPGTDFVLGYADSGGQHDGSPLIV